jgi:hypothetical protein
VMRTRNILKRWVMSRTVMEMMNTVLAEIKVSDPTQMLAAFVSYKYNVPMRLYLTLSNIFRQIKPLASKVLTVLLEIYNQRITLCRQQIQSG